MANATIEERLTVLEAEMERLKQEREPKEESKPLPWYEKIFGSFANSEAYEEAMQLGREYRESLRPKEGEEPVLW